MKDVSISDLAVLVSAPPPATRQASRVARGDPDRAPAWAGGQGELGDPGTSSRLWSSDGNAGSQPSVRLSLHSGLSDPENQKPDSQRRRVVEDHRAGPMSSGQQDQARSHGQPSSPPHQVLFSHLPLHSQLQVRSPFPMVPIGGIQMVHSIPVSLTSGHAPPDHGHIPSSRHHAHIPADQAHMSPSSRHAHTPPGHAHISTRHAHTPPGHAHNSASHAHSAQQAPHHPHHHHHHQQQQSPRLPFQKSGSDDSCEVTSCHLSGSSSDRGGVAGGGGGAEWPGDTPPRDAGRSPSVGGPGEEGGPEQEESVLTCTEAIASLCIDGLEGGARDPPLASPQPRPPSPPLPASPRASRPRRSQQHFTDPHPPPHAHPKPNPEHTPPPNSTGPAQTAPAPKPHGGAPKVGAGAGRPASRPLAPEEREREK
ncbi:unnamed protein product [Boreogadus saida]